MDDYTKAVIRYWFEKLKKCTPENYFGICNFLKGYLSALNDSGTISKEELMRGLDDIDTWVEEEKAKVEHGND